ncbi:MAG: type II toxin-antitoxin system prevent-host-death family antitoxin [Nocardioides sp.]|nr:type II toxin-antitoxin system prevent-host-death family antitoxin [Nocardioides sp.]
MTIVNVYEAKSSLSRLIAEAEAGETIVIARNGRPVAQLGPIPKRAVRTPGRMKGKVHIADDFDEWTEDDEAAWYGDNELLSS